MPSVLDTQGINGAIIDIIEQSEEFLILISPFVRFAPIMRRSIENADSRGVNIVIVYGKTEMQEQEYLWIKTLKHIQLSFSETLHAKAYFNEETAVIGSMNLYDYSQINNEELGILLHSKDGDLLDGLLYYSDRIIDRSSIEYATVEYRHSMKESLTKRIYHEASFAALSEPIDVCKTVNGVNLQKDANTTSNDRLDHCIRCGKNISDQTFYCDRCLEQWMRFKNMDYPERFCAICGRTSATSAMKPVCKDCFPRYEAYVLRKRDHLRKISDKL